MRVLVESGEFVDASEVSAVTGRRPEPGVESVEGHRIVIGEEECHAGDAIRYAGGDGIRSSNEAPQPEDTS